MKFAIFVCFLGVLSFAAAGSIEGKSKEEKEEIIKKFYKCIACSPNDQARADYAECCKKKPKRITEISEECKTGILANPEDIQSRWTQICESDEILTKVYSCIDEKLSANPITEAEQEEGKPYKLCLMEMNEKYCL
uniref:U69-Liphistoxin-Lsp1a_1 n=2 Tax=Liphistius TaxID=62150 RepID=A0A4Q8K0W0_9ARAC